MLHVTLCRIVVASLILLFWGDAEMCEQDEDRVKEFGSGTYSSAIGSCTAWFEPYVAPAVARVAGPAAAAGWVGSSLLPATLAYSTVKGT